MFSSTPTSMHFPTIIKYISDMEKNPLMEALQRRYHALGSVSMPEALGNGSTTGQSTLMVPRLQLWREMIDASPTKRPLIDMLYVLSFMMRTRYISSIRVSQDGDDEFRQQISNPGGRIIAYQHQRRSNNAQSQDSYRRGVYSYCPGLLSISSQLASNRRFHSRTE
jgi:hypothetical protein